MRNNGKERAMRLAQLVPTHHERRPTNSGHRYGEGWAWVRVRGAFFPDLVEARAGERLRLVFTREETAACSEQIVIPGLGKSVMLPPFEDVAVELGPLPPGEYEFTCGLGVLRGRILARDDAASGSVVSTEPRAALVRPWHPVHYLANRSMPSRDLHTEPGPSNGIRHPDRKGTT
jgi:Cupredoxin-like domain